MGHVHSNGIGHALYSRVWLASQKSVVDIIRDGRTFDYAADVIRVFAQEDVVAEPLRSNVLVGCVRG